MNLHEYQSKKIFAQYGLPVSTGFAVKSAEEAIEAAKKIGGNKWVIKAQVHAGGRGKAGGVKLVSSDAEIRAFAEKLLGTRLVTYQTTEKGQPVDTLLIEACTDIEKELYLSAVVDRASRRVVFMASTEGGVDIEKVAHETPEKIIHTAIDPLVGAQPFQARQIAERLNLNALQTKQFTDMFLKLAKLFVEKDVALLEVNPLVITTAGNLHCLDAKVVIDSSALFRHPDLKAMEDLSQEDERERIATEWELNYVSLEGNIGCMVNGAGLAMATMDLVQLKGGSPANFLDVGGGATRERVREAFKIILSDEKVKCVFVNIFGGIVRCDLIADGIMSAIADVSVSVPVVVRLEGNNAQLGAEKLRQSGLNIIAARTFDEGAEMAVKAAGGAV
jgi:succinyl-CoA synthetase beta subunit